MNENSELKVPWPRNSIVCADALHFLRETPDESVNCVVTSPPYWGLRSYLSDDDPDKKTELGQEATLEEYVAQMVVVFREVRRVLRSDGTCWLNLGDSYAGGGNYSGGSELSEKQATSGGAQGHRVGAKTIPIGLKSKDLCGIPWRVALALQADGWWLRSDIIWHKPNPMPGSMTDRPTSAHEYVFLLSKSARYFYDADAIKTPVKPSSIKRQGRAVSESHKHSKGAPGQTSHTMLAARPNKQDGAGQRSYTGFNDRYEGQAVPMANRRDVWTIPTAQLKESHFATYPPELVRLCILAGSPLGGLILDPFMGSGTTALIARKLGRDFWGCDLSPEYVKMARTRLANSDPYQPTLVYDEYGDETELQQMPLFTDED